MVTREPAFLLLRLLVEVDETDGAFLGFALVLLVLNLHTVGHVDHLPESLVGGLALAADYEDALVGAH